MVWVGVPVEKLELYFVCDADLAGDINDFKSTSGGLLVLVGPHTWSPLSAMSKKQTAVSLSSVEAELASLVYGMQNEAIPMLQLWSALLGREVKLVIWEDNESTIKIIKKGRSPKLGHFRRTHRIYWHWLSDLINTDPNISLQYIKSELQAADIFTKAITDRVVWNRACTNFGLCKGNPIRNDATKIIGIET